MQEYFFADYRLLVDDELSEHKSMRYLADFKNSMPYTHTFTVHLGAYELLDEKYHEAVQRPIVCETERFTIHDLGDSWALASVPDSSTKARNGKSAVFCSRDYGEMTLYMSDKKYYSEHREKWCLPPVPFSRLVRPVCEAGMVMRDGLPLHASLVEKDGYGIIFLGPSGMGKSTQAGLWVEYQNADFIIGDRPGLRFLDGKWYGFGMPWDGKDGIMNQKKVPVKALVNLEQAKENQISKLDRQQAMTVLLNQAMMPMWDDAAMGHAAELMAKASSDLPFYHLKNLPNREATEMTLRMINEGGKT